MLSFYDPADRHDQKRVERLLRDGGIEYFLRDEPETALHASQILIAEEDVGAAERLLAGLRH